MTERVARYELGEPWPLEALGAIGAGRAELHFGARARQRVLEARRAIEAIAEGGERAPSVYGVNTGFGALAETRIAPEAIRQLQLNLVRSHACGVGEPLPVPVVRAMIALRAQVLALGHSGVRPEVIEALLALLRADVVPVVPSRGSVGASGDLAPLAHLALVLLGEGEAFHRGERLPGGEALRRAGLRPLHLEAKEGLSLVNGTQMMLALGGWSVLQAEQLCRQADIVGAMSLEALKGSSRPFSEAIQRVRPHPGQAAVAANLRRLLDGSGIMESHRDCHKVQDPYSLRCMPQVHGASRDLLAWVRRVLEREIASVTDNPLVFVDGEQVEVVSGGNFHGQPLALALDAAAMAVAELANVAERRIEQLVNPALSSGLPPFLGKRTGLDSGFMMAQVTAASLIVENRVLSHPASVDSIPSSAGKEDHVSMGSVSALKLARVVEHTRRVLAIEAMVAAQGIELRRPLRAGVGVEAALQTLRARVAPLDGDRPLHPDMAACEAMLREGELLTGVESRLGRLQ